MRAASSDSSIFTRVFCFGIEEVDFTDFHLRVIAANFIEWGIDVRCQRTIAVASYRRRMQWPIS